MVRAGGDLAENLQALMCEFDSRSPGRGLKVLDPTLNFFGIDLHDILLSAVIT